MTFNFFNRLNILTLFETNPELRIFLHLYRIYTHKQAPKTLYNKTLDPCRPSSWAGWICFESEVEVEAAKGVSYRRSMLRAV